MKSFFKSFLNKDKPAITELNHPSALVVGDIIVLDDSFGLPEVLRGKRFEVSQISLAEYQGGDEKEWMLRSEDGDTLFMSCEREDGEDTLQLGIKISRDQVETLFDLEQFSTVFDDEDGAVLTTVTPVEPWTQWLAKRYTRTEFCEPGFFHKSTSKSSEGESFEFYALISDCERYGINIEVWDGGETDVSLALYRPITEIREYWPSSSNV